MLKGELLKRKNFSLEDSIFILSAPRGGSTWLGEIFNALPNTIINWEPFHPKFGVLPKDFKGGDAIYIPEENSIPTFKKVLEEILRFKKYTDFTLSFCTLQRVRNSKMVITKSVRAVSLLPWIVKHLNLKRKPIYLLRHPVATAFSHLKAFGNPEESLQPFEVPDFINNERFIQHRAYLNTLQSKVERQVALWCLNNSLVINHPDHGKKWLVVYYEDLVLHPKREVEKLLADLNLPQDTKLLDTINFKKPSQTDMDQDFIKNGIKQLEKWKAWLSPEEQAAIQKIFDHFNFKLYSANESMPNKTLENQFR